MEYNFASRYKEVDGLLESLQKHMLPKNGRTEEEIIEASIYYHKALVKRWEIKLEEFRFNEWVKEQTEKKEII